MGCLLGGRQVRVRFCAQVTALLAELKALRAKEPGMQAVVFTLHNPQQVALLSLYFLVFIQAPISSSLCKKDNPVLVHY